MARPVSLPAQVPVLFKAAHSGYQGSREGKGPRSAAQQDGAGWELACPTMGPYFLSLKSPTHEKNAPPLGRRRKQGGMPLGNLPSGSRASGLSQLPNPGCSPWGWAQRHQPSSESESTWRAEVEGGEREGQGHVSSPPSVPLTLAPGATLVLPQPRDACPTAPPPGQGVRQLNGGDYTRPGNTWTGLLQGAEVSPHQRL